MEILNTPNLLGRQPCFSMGVKALLLNTRPAAGHNPAGTIPRLLGKTKITATVGIQDKLKQTPLLGYEKKSC